LLIVGLVSGRLEFLHFGVVVLMLTPVARVIVVAVSLFRSRDWLFGGLSLWVLTVLASSILLSFSSLAKPRSGRPPRREMKVMSPPAESGEEARRAWSPRL